ncbi:hypothetical protein PQU92_08040 [Asticcacaulis sp. BYS171W]|uniref:Uncharacterized protein n=1 Tax=Asticcacaulis aquaticus TaxID=2984212 RepID=A0ABT5HT56_9CAUL|nr:hypothetical protein [Asticcacaulis aquaticus]MDC7683224.1 hypothetical protein [Asticcacaulis aquaticus]
MKSPFYGLTVMPTRRRRHWGRFMPLACAAVTLLVAVWLGFG